MSPVTHTLIGWLTANLSLKLSRKELAIITIAGVIPDIDGLGLIAEVLTKNTSYPLLWWTEYHHILHNIGFALVVTFVAFAISKHRVLTSVLSFISFHLHLLGDLVGSRGPDGYQWAIPYLLPFSNSWQLTWQYQWQLNAWQNFVITGIVVVITFILAFKRGYSIVGLFSEKADKLFIQTLKNRFSKN